MVGRQKVILQPRYYWHNFRYVLDFVRRLYGGLLNEAETDFLNRFDALSTDAQCVYVRVSNRKGVFFRVNKLNYREINDLPVALGELLNAGFVERLQTRHEGMGHEALDVFTKPDLIDLLPL
ncbi:MAG TPA: VRR-NUC domain-containing protein, partial [Fibrella sp.]